MHSRYWGAGLARGIGAFTGFATTALETASAVTAAKLTSDSLTGSIARQTVVINGNKIALSTLIPAIAGATAKTKLFSITMKGALGASVIGALFLLTDLFYRAGTSAKDAAEDIENFDEFLQAAKQDTIDFNQAVGDAKDEFTVIGRVSGKAGEEISDYGRTLAVVSGDTETLQNAVEGVTQAFEGQTIAIGGEHKGFA